MLPESAPAGLHGIFVLNIGTFVFCSIERRDIPASNKAPSHVNEHPIRNATESSGQYSVASVTSFRSSPF